MQLQRAETVRAASAAGGLSLDLDTPPPQQAFEIFFDSSQPARVDVFIHNPRPVIDGRFSCSTSLLFTSKPGGAESNALIVVIKTEARQTHPASA